MWLRNTGATANIYGLDVNVDNADNTVLRYALL